MTLKRYTASFSFFLFLIGVQLIYSIVLALDTQHSDLFLVCVCARVFLKRILFSNEENILGLESHGTTV